MGNEELEYETETTLWDSSIHIPGKEPSDLKSTVKKDFSNLHRNSLLNHIKTPVAEASEEIPAMPVFRKFVSEKQPKKHWTSIHLPNETQ